MLALPLPATDELQLADWLELNALMSEDHNSSYVDLERALRREGVVDADESGLNDETLRRKIHIDEAIERKINQITFEIGARSRAADRAYPFVADNHKIELRSEIDSFVPYIFCLCISWFGAERTQRPRIMFENLSCVAAKNFIGGEVVRFAHPRTDLPSAFDQAIQSLCSLTNEGGGFRPQRTRRRKDDRVDVVAWKHFPDHGEGKLMLFGNCASGNDWRDKLTEVQPEVFCQTWMLEMPLSVSLPNVRAIRAFFMPYRIASREWRDNSLQAGIIFDRCRIAYLVSESNDFADKRSYLKWIDQMLDNAIQRSDNGE